MCALVLTDSLFFAYVVLELLTLGTYLVVGTWFNQSLVVKGARDAFLTKRVGDLVLLAGLVALLPVAGSWNINALDAWAEQATPQPRPHLDPAGPDRRPDGQVRPDPPAPLA